MEKIAIITGATGGLGKAFIKELLKENLDSIWAVGRNKDKLDKLKSEFKDIIFPIECDLTNIDDFNRKIKEFNMLLKLVCVLNGGFTLTHNLYYDENEEPIDTQVVIASKKDVVEKVEIKEVITSKNNTTLAYFEDKLKKKYEELNKLYKGYTVKTTTEKGKAIVTATADYSKIDIEKFGNANDTIKDDIKKSKKMTSEIAKKYYESLGASCK